MYELSNRFSQLLGLAKRSLALSVTQYRIIVDNSSRGVDCPYAVRAAVEARKEKADVLLFLDELQRWIDATRTAIEREL